MNGKVLCEDGDRQFVEQVFRKHFNDPFLKVHSVSCTAATAEGTNFLSVIQRATVSGKFSDARKPKDLRESVIIKRQLKCKIMRESYNGDDAFNNEIRAYSTIVPILNKMSPSHPMPYPECLYSGRDNQKNDIILLEDLKTTGYYPPDRRAPLNFKQCKCVMEKFAQLHATSMVLRIVNKSDFDRAHQALNDYHYTKMQKNGMALFYDVMVQMVMRTMPSINGDGKLLEAQTFLEKHFTNSQLFNVAQRLILRETDENLLAICHGDSWMHNVMFKQNADGDVEDVRFVDLQIMRLACPVIDLLHFIYSGTVTSLRKQYYDELLATYQTALFQNIDRLAGPFMEGMPGIQQKVDHLKSLWTIDQLRRRMHEYSLYGLAQLILLLPIATFETEKVIQHDLTGINESYKTILRDTLLEFQEQGFFTEKFVI